MGNDRNERDNISLSDEMNAKGIEFADRGWLDEAARYFQKAIELDPESGHAWDNLAGVLAAKSLQVEPGSPESRWREALSAHLKAIELEPDVPAAHYNLAQFMVNYALEVARHELKETIARDPEYPEAHLSLGLVLADLGQTEEAIGELREAIRIVPDDAYPRHELASLLMETGDVRGAISELREVTRLDPENKDAWLDLAGGYARKGFFAEAERALERAAALAPGDTSVEYALAALYAEWGRTKEALVHLAGALKAGGEMVRSWLRNDPAFDDLRRTREFLDLLDE